MSEKKQFKLKVKQSFLPVFTFCVILWLVKLIEQASGYSFATFGILPQDPTGIRGVIFSPFIHGDFMHLFNNTVTLLVTGTALSYFYNTIAFRVSFLIFLLSGLMVWIFGRTGTYHIGASGIIYGLVTFLFFSGLIRKHRRLIGLSLLMVFLYGGMIWGTLPILEGISWEGHIAGSVSGLLAAIVFRKLGPQCPEPPSDEEDDDHSTQDYQVWDDKYLNREK